MSVTKILLGISAAGTTGISGTYIVKEFVIKEGENKNQKGPGEKEESDSEDEDELTETILKNG